MNTAFEDRNSATARNTIAIKQISLFRLFGGRVHPKPVVIFTRVLTVLTPGDETSRLVSLLCTWIEDGVASHVVGACSSLGHARPSEGPLGVNLHCVTPSQHKFTPWGPADWPVCTGGGPIIPTDGPVYPIEGPYALLTGKGDPKSC